MSEYEFEPIRGLPGVPPKGETILWQGAPSWWALATQAFHLRAVAGYFAAMLAWRIASGISDGQSPAQALWAAVLVAPLALIALAALAFFGWLNSRSTVYTITSRRVVLRFGAAFTKAINLPFTVIEGAALKSYEGGHGDLALELKAPNKIAFLQLWPHARPWRLSSPQPTLRGLVNGQEVAGILADAMRGQVALRMAPASADTREPAQAGPLGPHVQAA